MKFELKTCNRNVSDENLISDLKRVAKEFGKDKITNEEYNEKGNIIVVLFNDDLMVG